jgi:hypothetical protein
VRLDLKYIGEYRTVSALLKKCCYFLRKCENFLNEKAGNTLFCDHFPAHVKENKKIHFLYLFKLNSPGPLKITFYLHITDGISVQSGLPHRLPHIQHWLLARNPGWLF